MQNTMLGMRGEPMEGCSRTPRRAKYCLKGVSIRYSGFVRCRYMKGGHEEGGEGRKEEGG
jgi:hypothetical protein